MISYNKISSIKLYSYQIIHFLRIYCVKLFHFTTLTFFLSTIFVTQILAQTSPKSSLKDNGEVLYNIPQQKVDSPLGMISEGQEDSMYYYGGIVKNLQSYPELQYRVRLGYRDFYNDAYKSNDYLF